MYTILIYIYIPLLAIIVFIVRCYSCRDVSKCLPTLNRELMEDESKDTTKTHLGESMNFIGATYRNMGQGLLTRAEMTQTAVSPKSTLARGIFRGSWNLEHIVQRICNLTVGEYRFGVSHFV